MPSPPISPDREAEIRRQLRRLNAALDGIGNSEAAGRVGKAVAALEQELVGMLGSKKAYRIVEEIRTAITDSDNPRGATKVETERLRELQAAIGRKEAELNEAIDGAATIAETRRINKELATLIDERRRLIARQAAESLPL
jgi:hypothetical protein